MYLPMTGYTNFSKLTSFEMLKVQDVYNGVGNADSTQSERGSSTAKLVKVLQLLNLILMYGLWAICCHVLCFTSTYTLH